ncbi:MAG: translation elongation factor Ts [Oscillospiraceae bacterium]|nr:translation elongation factor Ts [Oscillospiraceae bacterium]MDE6776504.1 translation elongation factor Ts [Oscillospiraceae bacterium]MDE7094049.1 translation elongation factor Ts [Oscillospiraceae bacterium]
MAITVADINELRQMTGAGIMACKKALTEAEGDKDKAVQLLREQGLATQAKKAGRVAAEGLALALVNEENTIGAVVEVNIETDFAAKNPKFKEFVENVAKTVIEQNPADVEALKNAVISGGEVTVAEALQELFLSVRENIQIRRFQRLEGDAVVAYVHQGGQAGVLTSAKTTAGAAPAVLEALKDCDFQVAAMHPDYLVREDVPESRIEEEREIILKQMEEDPKMAGKPEQVKAGIAKGKLGKIYSELCLMEQTFVKDNKLTVKQYVDSKAKEAGADITITGYVCFELGEGIEKKSDDFAAEVASMIG